MAIAPTPVIGGEPAARQHGHADHGNTSAAPDFLADPGPRFEARDAELPPLPAGRVHRHTLTVREHEHGVSPGMTQRLWGYDGQSSDPVLHGRVVDRSYLLVQSELYLGPEGGPVDVDKVDAERPDAVVFNGYANQYDHRPLAARVGERVRAWVLDAGLNRATAFHVVGAQFDAAYAEGAHLLRRGEAGGAQTLGLQPSQGGFVELSFPQPGRYSFVSHVMVDAERGAHGVFRVTR